MGIRLRDKVLESDWVYCKHTKYWEIWFVERRSIQAQSKHNLLCGYVD